MRADGTVEVNVDSPAYHLNDDRFARVQAPADADGKGAPHWKQLSRTGRFEWHDHRMHWMSEQPPGRLVGVEERRKIFDWSVPLRIDGRAGAITGTLFWTPRVQGGPPTAAIALLAGLIVACCIAVAVVRRRRSPREPADGFYFLSYKKVPGWKVKVVKRTLDTPVDLGGFSVDERYTRVTFTARRRGIIRPGQYEEFPLSVRVPDGRAGDVLVFKAIQTYQGGERVRWTGARMPSCRRRGSRSPRRRSPRAPGVSVRRRT